MLLNDVLKKTKPVIDLPSLATDVVSIERPGHVCSKFWQQPWVMQ
jgi:hypothetical protein